MKYLIIGLLLFCSCGPSIEEKIAYEQYQRENSKEIEENNCRVKVIFESGLVDTLDVSNCYRLLLSGENLINNLGPGKCNVVIARKVSAFSKINK